MTVWGPFVLRDNEQVSAQSRCLVVSGNGTATEQANELTDTRFMFFCAVGHNFQTFVYIVYVP